MRMKDIAKIAFDRFGTFHAYHRLVNRHSLTVAMFHRVLPARLVEDGASQYAVSDALFRQCLRFFRRHYNPVGLDDVLAAREGARPLPPCALLVTFDDGWADNLAVAAPILAAEAIPAVVFVSSDPIADPALSWWQETLSAVLRQGRADIPTLWRALPDVPGGTDAPADLLSLLLRYGACPPEARLRALQPFEPADEGVRDMLTPEDLRTLAGAGIAIGAHGACHLPLTRISDPADDLRRSRQDIERLLGQPCLTLSFPHGRYSAAIAQDAKDMGYRLQFTSDPILNTLDHGTCTDLLGRIEITASQITDREGALSPHRMACWMFLRPRRALAVQALAEERHAGNGFSREIKPHVGSAR